MPVISSLIPNAPTYRLLSFVTHTGARPMSYVSSRYSQSAHGHEHNCIGVEVQDFCSLESRTPHELGFDCQGIPFEIGYGHLLSLHYQSNSAHPGSDAGISSMTYELSLIFIQLKSYINCRPELEQHYLLGMDLSKHYEPVSQFLVQMALKHPQFMPLNDAYEMIVRNLCGSDSVGTISVKEYYGVVFESFQKYMSQQMQVQDALGGSWDSSHLFRLHRVVSFISL